MAIVGAGRPCACSTRCTCWTLSTADAERIHCSLREFGDRNAPPSRQAVFGRRTHDEEFVEQAFLAAPRIRCVRQDVEDHVQLAVAQGRHHDIVVADDDLRTQTGGFAQQRRTGTRAGPPPSSRRRRCAGVRRARRSGPRLRDGCRAGSRRSRPIRARRAAPTGVSATPLGVARRVRAHRGLEPAQALAERRRTGPSASDARRTLRCSATTAKYSMSRSSTLTAIQRDVNPG